MEKFALILNDIAITIWNLFVLNFFWIAGTLIGGVVLGIAPATTSLCAVMRENMRQSEKNNVKNNYKFFVTYYKNNFWRSVKLFLPIMIITYLMMVAYMYIKNTGLEINVMLRVSNSLAFLIFLALYLYLPSVYAHYHYDNIFKYYVFSIILMFRRIHITIIVLVIPYLIIRLIGLLMPGLVFLMGISIVYYISNRIIYADLNRIITE